MATEVECECVKSLVDVLKNTYTLKEDIAFDKDFGPEKSITGRMTDVASDLQDDLSELERLCPFPIVQRDIRERYHQGKTLLGEGIKENSTKKLSEATRFIEDAVMNKIFFNEMIHCKNGGI